MSLIDGTPGPLTLGQAFVEMAKLAPWGSEVIQLEVIKTFHTAFPDDVTPYGAAPQTGVTDPMIAELSTQAIKLAQQQQELAELRAQLAEAQLSEARAQLAAIHAGAAPSDAGVTDAVQPPAEPGPHSLADASARSRGEDVQIGDGAVVVDDSTADESLT